MDGMSDKAGPRDTTRKYTPPRPLPEMIPRPKGASRPKEPSDANGEALKRCPFCGAEAEHVLNIVTELYAVECENGHLGPRAKTHDEAARLWNERAGDGNWGRIAEDRVTELGIELDGANVRIAELEKDCDEWKGMSAADQLRIAELEAELNRQRCPKCGGEIRCVMVKDSYGHEDSKYTCQNPECGHRWWVDGIDS